MARHDRALSALVAEIEEKALPPNCRVRDTEDGKILIKPVSQKTTPDWDLLGASSIVEEPEDEPITKTVIMAQDRDENKAQSYFYATNTLNQAPTVTNPDRALDGTDTLNATQATPGTAMTFRFRLPKASPPEAYPNLKYIEVVGRGFLTVYTIQDPSSAAATKVLPALARIPMLGTDGTNNANVTRRIDGDELISALAKTTDNDIIIQMDEDDTSGTIAPTIAEIRLVVQDLVAWSAFLTDDTTGYGTPPANWIPTDTATFGTIWWQPDPQKRESIRYAPPAYMKRVLTLWNATGSSQKHHTANIEMSGAAQQDARDYAEMYQDEYTRSSRRYRLRAPIYDAAELGDTVRVSAPPGFEFNDGTDVKLLLLHGFDDGGGKADLLADYILADYS
ncbi:MAG: hypothetical protein A3E78_08485 [Alphaproteobacteria bacterium RIFCSPHIGHO2_12_FULL_63_12]|nr:MAG: hypothetical protein A3E78_08485 [Alphaproteobacteria bacterium RIFCSPHIGHO2_12_FULL_63_12]